MKAGRSTGTRGLVDLLQHCINDDPGDAPAVNLQDNIAAAPPVVLPLGERGYLVRLVSYSPAGAFTGSASTAIANTPVPTSTATTGSMNSISTR